MSDPIFRQPPITARIGDFSASFSQAAARIGQAAVTLGYVEARIAGQVVGAASQVITDHTPRSWEAQLPVLARNALVLPALLRHLLQRFLPGIVVRFRRLDDRWILITVDYDAVFIGQLELPYRE